MAGRGVATPRATPDPLVLPEEADRRRCGRLPSYPTRYVPICRQSPSYVHRLDDRACSPAQPGYRMLPNTGSPVIPLTRYSTGGAVAASSAEFGTGGDLLRGIGR